MEDRGKVVSSNILYHKEEVNTYITYLPEGSKEAAVVIFTRAAPIPKDHLRMQYGEKIVFLLRNLPCIIIIFKLFKAAL